MTGPRATPLLLALALLPGACDSRASDSERSSITVKLPPPKPKSAAPAFSFKGHEQQNLD